MAKKGTRTGEYHNCLVCSKQFYVFPRDIRKGAGKYCSVECKSISQIGIESTKRSGKLEDCIQCGKQFYAPKWWVKKKAKYCSRRCYWESKIGKRPWNYEGKTAINTAIRKTKVYRRWSAEVKKRDNYTCLSCGKRGGYLESDHIKPFSLYPELRFHLDNGRTLCKICHIKTDTYGCRSIVKKENFYAS